jgi:hypothetical protein
MLIISKKKDYYDGVVQTTGIDKTIVYNRKQNDIRDSFDDYKKLPADLIKLVENLTAFHLDTKKTNLELKGIYIIAFCGQMYVAWEMIDRKPFNDYDPKSIITYDLKGMQEIVIDKTWRDAVGIVDAYRNLVNYDPMKLHRLYNSPVFAIDTAFVRYGARDSNFILNPTLKTYKFFKLFDSFQALQEIQMFISGVLGTGENKMIEVADKYKIESHGFDKTSFRKEKK